ncbi:hypothetical protein HY469_02155 [Candidatus Roizmanbacteria bacterium]|nr:hypothetical protein [Candidatus Roizmanbacteria bacterium]
MKLQEMAGETNNAEYNQVKSWRDQAIAKRIQQLDMRPQDIEAADAGGFLWLVPETADLLIAAGAQNKIHEYIYGNTTHKGHEYLMPYWFVSRVDEATRNHHFHANNKAENSMSQYYDYSSLFNAKAFALKESRSELEKYLDVPAVERGDLYYIQNLVSTIEATGGTNPTPTSSQPTPTQPPTGSSIQAGTGQAVNAGTTLPVAATITSMINEAVTEAKAAYGSGTPKAIFIANNAGGWPELAAKITEEFGSVPVIAGVGTNSSNYNTMTGETFVEHDYRSLALFALGGTAITKVQAAGQYNVGQQSAANYPDDITAGEQIANDLLSHFDSTKSNIVHLFGPGHGPHHLLILCGFKQRLGNVIGKCDPANPDNPELSGIPDVPNHIKIIGAPGYFNGSSFLNGTLDGGSVTGVLIQGTFAVAGRGLSGTPTTTNVPPLITDIKQELGGTPDVLFYVPGHPAATTYDAVRQSVLTSLGGTSAIFGNEGGGEWGHLTTSSQPIAVSNHLFMVGLKGSATTSRVSGDVNDDQNVNLTDLSALLSVFGSNVAPNTGPDFNGDGIVNLSDLSTLLANFGTQ